VKLFLSFPNVTLLFDCIKKAHSYNTVTRFYVPLYDDAIVHVYMQLKIHAILRLPLFTEIVTEGTQKTINVNTTIKINYYLQNADNGS